MKNTIKVSILVLLIIMLFIPHTFAIGDILSKGEDWTNIGSQHTGQTMDTTEINKVSSDLYNLLLAVATVVAVIVGAILGIKFMTAGIDEKVQVKESLFPYLISSIVVFGSLGIWKLVVKIMSSF